MWAVHGVYRPTATSELRFVLLPTVMSPVGQGLVGLVAEAFGNHGAIRNILRVGAAPAVPTHCVGVELQAQFQVDRWDKLMLPFEMIARSALRLIVTLLLEAYVHEDRILTTNPL